MNLIRPSNQAMRRAALTNEIQIVHLVVNLLQLGEILPFVHSNL